MSQDDGFSKLQPGSFDGIVVPVVRVRFRTGSGAARHRYPYRPGQDIQYTGRDPISGTLLAAYFNGLFDEGATDVLWPGTLTTLRSRVQEQRSGPLVIPTLGTITAKIEIDEEYIDAARDGAYVSINFEEDSTDAFIAETLTSALSELTARASELDRQLDRLKIQADLRMPDLDEPGTLSDFTSGVASLQNSITTWQDDLARPLRQADALVERCRDLLSTTDSLKDPSNWAAVSALKGLMVRTQDAVSDTLAGQRRLKVFVTQAATNATSVAIATANTVADVIALNLIENANDIDAGTALFVYAA